MKIKSVEVHILRKELSTSMQISRGGFKTRRHCIIQIVTDDNVYGLGEGVGNPDAIMTLVDKCISPLIIGFDCTDIAAIQNKLLYDSVYFERSGSWVCAVSAIEMALWDIKGKYEQKPVYELLGGLQSNSLEIYASDVYWYEDTGLVQKDIESILEKGIVNVKIHTGVLDPKQEQIRFKKISKCFSRIQKLMIDLNCAYSFENSILAVKYFEEFNPFWIEEPLKITEEIRLCEVKALSSVPLAYGENLMNLEGFHYLFQGNSIDYAMPDIARVGGIQTSLNILDLCEKMSVTPSFHNFSSGVLLAATIHIMAARSEAQLLEFDSSQNSVIHEFFPEQLRINHGKMAVPATVGLGVLLTDDVLKYKEN